MPCCSAGAAPAVVVMVLLVSALIDCKAPLTPPLVMPPAAVR